jgi:hypothetical protein
MLNVQEFLNESFAAMMNNGEGCVDFVEKWVPEVVNEIEALRNKIVLLETRTIELEQQVAELEA